MQTYFRIKPEAAAPVAGPIGREELLFTTRDGKPTHQTAVVTRANRETFEGARHSVWVETDPETLPLPEEWELIAAFTRRHDAHLQDQGKLRGGVERPLFHLKKDQKGWHGHDLLAKPNYGDGRTHEKTLGELLSRYDARMAVPGWVVVRKSRGWTSRYEPMVAEEIVGVHMIGGSLRITVGRSREKESPAYMYLLAPDSATLAAYWQLA